jgi:hypothetical protein
MDELYNAALESVYKNLNYYAVEGGYGGRRYVAASSSKIYDDFFAKYKDAYSAYSGGNSDLYTDFNTYFYTQVTDYWQKDFSIETILLIGLENFQKINWGYIPEYQRHHCLHSLE